MADTTPPRLRDKLSFWLLLSVLSVAIAEVSVASAPLAFVNPLETVFLTFFYGSHLLLFAWAAFRKGWPTLPTLWFAGVLFGLYEFYITKVLWSPPWGDVISFAHVDVVSLVVLAFFWHPFMAFIFPLAAAEKLGAAGQWVVDLLPAPRRRLVVGGGVAAVVIHGTLTGSPAVALVSTASAALAVVATAWWWRRGNRHERWTLPDLLPDKRQARRIGLLLVAQYAMFIPAWTPEKMPPLVGHVVVWLLYAGFLLLLNSSLEQSRQTPPERAEPLSLPSKRRLALLATGTLVLTMIGALIPAPIGFIPVWAVAIWFGVRMFYRSVKSVTGRGKPDQPIIAARLP